MIVNKLISVLYLYLNTVSPHVKLTFELDLPVTISYQTQVVQAPIRSFWLQIRMIVHKQFQVNGSSEEESQSRYTNFDRLTKPCRSN